MSSTDLWTIVYVSSAVEPFTEAQLQALLQSVRAANRANGLTGVLLYSDGNIMQCIEGPREQVDAAFERISRSRRHGGIFVLLNAPIESRSFPDWEMGFTRAASADMAELSRARWEQVDREILGVAPTGRGVRLLQGFWKRSGR